MRLSRNFDLEEFPCWERSTPAERAGLEELARTVLQPVRDRWGPVVPTSWGWWRNGCAPRTGDHAAGAVDFVPLHATTRQVARWMGENLHGRFGKVLDEHDHIHVTPPGVGGGRVYTLGPDGGWVELELIYGSTPPTHYAGTPNPGGALLALALALLLLKRPRR